jgi:hypothetical protein
MARKHSAFLASVYPKVAFSVNRPNWSGEMPPCPPCKEHNRAPCDHCDNYSMIEIPDTRDSEDIGENRHRPNHVDSYDLADDLASHSAHIGVFVAEEGKPTKEALAAARERLYAYLHQQIEESDKLYNAIGRRDVVSDHARLGVQVFNLKREWMGDTTAKKECVGCGAFIPATAVKCACGSVYDWEKADTLGLLSTDQRLVGIQSGKLAPPPVTTQVSPRKRSEAAAI